MYAVAAHLLLKIGVCRATIAPKGGDYMRKKKADNGKISVYDLFQAQRRDARKQDRKEYMKENRFEIIHVILSAVSILISVASLIISLSR